MNGSMKLSIIIPCYNTQPYLEALISRIRPQLTDEVEIIVIDDGSAEKVKIEGIKVVRQKNKGVSAARNRGLKEATGDYIAFIDSDDLVSEDYVEQILEAIKTEPDTVYLSWKAMNGKWGKTLTSDEDEFGTGYLKEHIYKA